MNLTLPLAQHYRGWLAPLPWALCVLALPALCQNAGQKPSHCLISKGKVMLGGQLALVALSLMWRTRASPCLW